MAGAYRERTDSMGSEYRRSTSPEPYRFEVFPRLSRVRRTSFCVRNNSRSGVRREDVNGSFQLRHRLIHISLSRNEWKSKHSAQSQLRWTRRLPRTRVAVHQSSVRVRVEIETNFGRALFAQVVHKKHFDETSEL